MNTELPPVVKSKIKVRVLNVRYYRDCPIYLRQIGKTYFEWLVIYKNQLYSGYIEMQPANGKHRLTNKEITKTMNIVLAGATTTVDSFYFREEEAAKELNAEKKEKKND